MESESQYHLDSNNTKIHLGPKIFAGDVNILKTESKFNVQIFRISSKVCHNHLIWTVFIFGLELDSTLNNFYIFRSGGSLELTMSRQVTSGHVTSDF